MAREKIQYKDLKLLEQTLIYWGSWPNLNSPEEKCIAAVLLQLGNKIARRTAGFVNRKGYAIKLTPAELHGLGYMKANLHPVHQVDLDNACVRLIKQNNG